MSISALEKIKNSVDKLARKEFYAAIGSALQVKETSNKGSTSKSFRSLVLNKALHVLTMADLYLFLKEYNKDATSQDAQILFNEYAKIARKRDYLVDNNAIYSIKASSLLKPGIKTYFYNFINHKPVSTNGLALLNKEFGDGFNIINSIMAGVKPSSTLPPLVNNYITAGLDLGHVHSNIEYLANIGTVSGFIDSSPKEINNIYLAAKTPEIKEHIFNQYKEQLLANKSSLSLEIQQEIFNSIYESQLELLREFGGKSEFKGLVSFKLTKAGSLANITKRAIESITKKAIVRVAPQNAEINQRLGRTVEAFYRTHLPIVYGSFLQTFRQSLNAVDLIDVKGSKSIREVIEATVVSEILGNNVPLTRVRSSTKKTNTAMTPSIKGTLKTKPPSNIATSRRVPPLRNIRGQFSSLTSVEAIIRASLYETIKKNMISPALNFRSGRFAGSVQLQSLSQERSGSIIAFLTYMKYPYGTFEPGFAQGSVDRSPTLLIDRSVREIALKLVTARMKTVII